MKQFKEHVKMNRKTVINNALNQNLSQQVLGLVASAGRITETATQEGKSFQASVRQYEYHLESLCQLLGFDRAKYEPDDEPTYTLPKLMELTCQLAALMYQRCDKGSTIGLVNKLNEIEHCLINFYEVYRRATTFNGGDATTRDDVLKIEGMH